MFISESVLFGYGCGRKKGNKIMVSAKNKTCAGDKDSGIRAVTFDMGNTLLFPWPSVGEVYAAAAARAGVRLDSTCAESLFLGAWMTAQKTQQGLIYGTDHVSGRAFWLRVLALAMEGFGLREGDIARLTDDLYETFNTPEQWRINPGWPEVRDALRQRGIRLGVVSNWDIRLGGLLRRIGLFPDFDSVVVSAEHAVEKPAPAIFRAAWNALDVRPEETLHIGDSWHDDVCGASAAGMRAVWFNAAGTACPEPQAAHRQVRSLPELLALV
jgi:putative hydrolase of the HAD superfamily